MSVDLFIHRVTNILWLPLAFAFVTLAYVVAAPVIAAMFIWPIFRRHWS